MGIWVLSFEPLWGRGFTGARSPLWECKGHFAGTPLVIIVKTMGSGDFVPWIFQAIGGNPSRVEPLWLVVGCNLRYSHFGLIISIISSYLLVKFHVVGHLRQYLSRQLFFSRWFCNIISPQKSRSRPVPKSPWVFQMAEFLQYDKMRFSRAWIPESFEVTTYIQRDMARCQEASDWRILGEWWVYGLYWLPFWRTFDGIFCTKKDLTTNFLVGNPRLDMRILLLAASNFT